MPCPLACKTSWSKLLRFRPDPAAYHHALMDWVEQGEASEFALSGAAVIERSSLNLMIEREGTLTSSWAVKPPHKVTRN